MIRSRYLICAQRIIRDAVDNRISVIDIFDDFVAQGFPLVLPRTSIIWVLEREAGDAQEVAGTVSVFLNDARLQDFNINTNFLDQTKARAILVVAGLVITGPGRLSFRIRRAGMEADDAEFAFNIGSSPAQEGAPPQAGGIIF
jgi:hypothetical protein